MKSCQGKGCWYNKGYVWTDIPCEDEQTKEAGVLALSGISEAPSKGVCITSASAVTARGKKISAQCCTASGECQRRSVKMPAEGKTCADVKGTMAAGSTCGARIKWVEDNKGMTKKDAQDFVGDEFPTDCGPCLVGTTAGTTSGTTTTTPTTTSTTGTTSGTTARTTNSTAGTTAGTSAPKAEEPPSTRRRRKAEEPPSTRRRRKRRKAEVPVQGALKESMATPAENFQPIATSQLVFQLGKTGGLPLNREYHEQTQN